MGNALKKLKIRSDRRLLRPSERIFYSSFLRHGCFLPLAKLPESPLAGRFSVPAIADAWVHCEITLHSILP
ncbi:MAG: hypothetical protein RSD27_10750, partial [Ruthenibacterium sp.]